MSNLRARLAAVAVAVLAVAATPIASSAAGTGGAGEGSRHHGSCGRAALLFCEDFERQPPGGASSLAWGVDTRHGTLRVEHGRQGGKVLHVHTEGNGYAFLKVLDLAAPGNTFYGRVRLRVDAFPTAPDWAHFTLAEITGSGSSEVVRPIGGQYVPTLDRSLWGVGADGGPTGDWTNWRESAPVTEDRWQCFEWSYLAADNRIDVWIDGVAKPDLTVTTTQHGGNPVDFILPTAQTVKVGWQLYQGGPTPDHFDLWMDDIALGSSRVGC